MNKRLGIMTASLCLASISTAMAATYGERSYSRSNDGSPYFGVSAGVLQYDEDGLDTITPSLIFARVGFPVIPNLAIEGRIGTGINSSDDHGYSVDVDTMLGGYLKGSFPLSPTFSLYGVAGLASLELHRNFGDGSSRDTGLSFGIGGDVNLRSNVSLNFEWTHFPQGDDAGYSYNSNTFTAGLNWHF